MPLTPMAADGPLAVRLIICQLNSKDPSNALELHQSKGNADQNYQFGLTGMNKVDVQLYEATI